MSAKEIQPYRTDLLPEELRPLGDRVLVRHLTLQDKEGSIFIPPIAQEKLHYTHMQGYVFRGVVVAVGPGCDYIERLNAKATKWVRRYLPCLVEPDVKVGDVVLFERRREAELILDGESFSIIHSEQSILAVEDKP